MDINHLTRIEKKVDKVIEVQNEHTKILEEHSKTLKEHGDQIDFLAETALEHRERMDAFDTRMDVFELRMDNFERRTEENFAAVRNEAQSNFDAIMTILKRLDDDRFATHSRLLRLEQHVGLS
jgi:hypothetical protein